MKNLRRRAEKRLTDKKILLRQLYNQNYSEMKKYFSIFKIGWQKVIEYRGHMLGHMILGVISFFAMFFIWGAVFKDRQYFGVYTFPSMMSYMLMVRFLHFANRGNIGRDIGLEIKNGSLSVYLLKPISYLKWWFFVFLSERIYEILLRGSMVIVFIIIFNKLLAIPGLNQVLLFICFLPISLLLNYLINVFIASVGFWTTDVRLFRSTIIMVIEFLGGMVVPIDLMPEFLGKICRFLPFQFTGYFPIKIYQGIESKTIVIGFLTSLVWIIVISILLRLLWRKGLKKYEAIGV